MDASDRRKRAAEEAAEWSVILQGEVSRTQREDYVDWLRESSMHIAEMLRVTQVHDALEQFDHWVRIPGEGSCAAADTVVTLPTPARRAQPPERPPGRLKVAWFVAAMLVVVTGLTAVLLSGLRGQVIQTERAERREVALADGSVVQVDPETRLRVRYEQHARRIFLERGRALFHVAKNPNRPFLVQTEDTTVRAVGTAFAVERQSESITVTVAEGKVAVFPTRVPPASDPSQGNGPAEVRGQASPGAPSGTRALSASGKGTGRVVGQLASPPTSAGPAPEIFLTANEQVTVARTSGVEPVRDIDSGRALAWADGRLIFENNSLNDAVQQFNRYNRIQIYLSDAMLARRPISGVFSAADPESFVAFIQSVAAVRVTRDDASDITIETAK